jgi:hypothetical protein
MPCHSSHFRKIRFFLWAALPAFFLLSPFYLSAQDRIELVGIKDFSTEVKGYVPYYVDKERLAINAVQYKNEYAAAQTVFKGKSGKYDLALQTLTETDGESTYRVKVNNKLIGEYKNPGGEDYVVAGKTWKGVPLKQGDVIQVESVAHSNGKIPEGDGFAYSRGRWTKLTLEKSKP